jgi:hypothetical protein
VAQHLLAAVEIGVERGDEDPGVELQHADPGHGDPDPGVDHDAPIEDAL